LANSKTILWGKDIGLKWVPKGTTLRYLGLLIGFSSSSRYKHDPAYFIIEEKVRELAI